MRIFLKLTSVLILLILIGCDKRDKCSDIACMPPPYVGVSFKAYNAEGENLITKGSLTVDNITLAESGNEIAHPYIGEDKSAFSFGFWVGERNYTMTIDKSVFDLKVTVSQKERKKGECCSGFQLGSFIMDGQEISVPTDNMIVITIE